MNLLFQTGIRNEEEINLHFRLGYFVLNQGTSSDYSRSYMSEE